MQNEALNVAEVTEDLGRDGQVKPVGRTGSGDRLSTKDILAIIKRQEERCALTGRPLNPSTAALDHIIPRSRGGGNSPANIQILHTQVNMAKGSMTQEEFIALCREVVAHADSQS